MIVFNYYNHMAFDISQIVFWVFCHFFPTLMADSFVVLVTRA